MEHQSQGRLAVGIVEETNWIYVQIKQAGIVWESFQNLRLCIIFKLVLFVYLRPTPCRCRGLLLHLITLNDPHTIGRTPLGEESARGRKFLLTYLLTPWSRVVLEKLASLQLVKKFPAFYITRRFLTALTSARHLSLSWASPIQFSYPNPTSWRSILILSSHLRLGLPSGLFHSGFPTSTLYTPLPSPIQATRPAHLIIYTCVCVCVCIYIYIYTYGKSCI